MRVKVDGRWLSCDDQVLVIELSQTELDQINRITRDTGDDRPRRYLQAPDGAMTRSELSAYIREG